MVTVGGDEFAIIFDNAMSEETITGFAQRMIERVARPKIHYPPPCGRARATTMARVRLKLMGIDRARARDV